jgi:hypothetical protein
MMQNSPIRSVQLGVVDFMDQIQANSKVNMMTSKNLAVVLGPNCLKSKVDLSPLQYAMNTQKVNAAFEELIHHYHKFSSIFEPIEEPSDHLSAGERLEKFLEDQDIIFLPVDEETETGEPQQNLHLDMQVI